jgi:HD-GYP domain-containing protein (c-di-GMP phosphodiesterase class II)
LDSIQHENSQVLERAWRTAFYGLHLAEGAGLAGSTLCQQVVLGLLLHEIEVEQMPGGCAASIIEGYRERIDGQGPLRWGPEKLTLPVRIACVAVAFDRKTSGADEEPRQPAFDVLRDFIAKDHGALDPRIIAGFIRILDR